MPLLLDRREHVATLTLSRPEARNAWDEDYNEGLQTLLPELEADPEVRCVVLTGDPAGQAFSAGANLAKETTHTVDSAADFISRIPSWQHFAANLLSDFAKPIVAAVNGLAIGIGSIATYSCDLIVASDRAEWRAPQVQLGVMPAYGGSPRLARWVGKGNAMRSALGWPIDAQEAYRTGLAQWLVPHDELMEQAAQIAGRIAELPPLASRLAKESLNKGMDIANIKDASQADIYRFAALSQTEDSLEAHRAWREKRTPEVRGR
ncbi:MAG: enoyl-CoA hydratase/isomerase family protein [Actinomycetota bacterium]|jgi:enoyl-CoA hydratase/carnithine racemase|nr:enoyl-CoA hydratase/isomerase family protein [Actinomycetota bacterium]